MSRIPSDSEGYQKWLAAQRSFFAKWDNLLQNLLSVQSEELSRLRLIEAPGNVWKAAFDERLEVTPPTYHTGMDTEYTYTIDLDSEIFSVDSGAHFRLDRISREENWIKALALDEKYNRFALPQYVSEAALTDLTVEAEDFATNALDYWKTLRTRIVCPKAAPLISTQAPTSRLRWMMFNVFQVSEKEKLSVTLLGWTAQDMPFRELAYFILCLAAGGDHSALINRRRIFERDGYAGVVAGNDREGEMEFISLLGTGCHKRGLPIGSAPESTKYWMEGALVSLVPRLNRPGVLQKAIADVIQYGQVQCGHSSFNAAVLSIEHLVLVKLLSDGSVEHTDLLPLVPIETHLSQDALIRYGEVGVNNYYNASLEQEYTREGKDLEESSHSSTGQNGASDTVIEPASTVNNDSSEGVGEELHEGKAALEEAPEDKVEPGGNDKDSNDVGLPDEEEGEKGFEKVDEDEDLIKWTAKETFGSLINFFEATILESLKPIGADGQGYPTEIYEMILRHVSDRQTYNACLKVSRQVRSLCLQRPLIMDNVLLIEPPSHVSTPLEDQADGKQQSRPELCAVEMSSNQQMDINIRMFHHTYDSDRSESTSFEIVAGSDWDRKSFCRSSITLRGLNIPQPWDSKEQMRQQQILEDFHNGRLGEKVSKSKRPEWDRAFRRYPISAESPTEDLGYFWSEAIPDIFDDPYASCIDPKTIGDSDWDLPPNTKNLFSSYDDYHDRGFFRFLMIRMKRTSKYWEGQWDDIVREATEKLGSVDNAVQIRLSKLPKDQVFGADDPYVLLTIGLEVRLFQWQQGFDNEVTGDARKTASPSAQLKELEPGKIYSLLDEADQEVIEEFLKTAAGRAAELTKIAEENELASYRKKS